MGAWVKYPGIKSNVFSTDPTNGKMYAGSATTGIVYLLDNGASDDGSSIQTYYKSPAIDFDAPERNKRFHRVYTQHATSPTSVIMNQRIDLTSSGATQTYDLSQTGSEVLKTNRFNYAQQTTGKYLEIILENTSASEVRMYPMVVYADIEEAL